MLSNGLTFPILYSWEIPPVCWDSDGAHVGMKWPLSTGLGLGFASLKPCPSSDMQGRSQTHSGWCNDLRRPHEDREVNP